MTGISNLQKMLLGRSLWAFPALLASHPDGWSDVLQTDSSGTCKRAALWSAAALLGIAEVKLEFAETPLAALQCGKEELMLGYHCCSTWKAPWHNTHIAREAPFLLSLSLPFFQTLWSEGEPLVWIVEIVESVAFLGDEKKAYFFFPLCLNLFYAFHCLTVLFLSSTR